MSIQISRTIEARESGDRVQPVRKLQQYSGNSRHRIQQRNKYDPCFQFGDAPALGQRRIFGNFCFFKRVDAAQETVAGSQLQKVVEFRRELEKAR